MILFLLHYPVHTFSSSSSLIRRNSATRGGLIIGLGYRIKLIQRLMITVISANTTKRKKLNSADRRIREGWEESSVELKLYPAALLLSAPDSNFGDIKVVDRPCWSFVVLFR